MDRLLTLLAMEPKAGEAVKNEKLVKEEQAGLQAMAVSDEDD